MLLVAQSMQNEDQQGGESSHEIMKERAQQKKNKSQEENQDKKTQEELNEDLEIERKEDKIRFILFLIHLGLCCQYSKTIKSSRLRLKRLMQFVFYAMREINV